MANKIMSTEQMLSTTQLAKKLMVSIETIRLWRNAGLPHLRLSEKTIRYNLDEVIQWRVDVMAAKKKKQEVVK